MHFQQQPCIAEAVHAKNGADERFRPLARLKPAIRATSGISTDHTVGSPRRLLTGIYCVGNL